MPHQKTRKQRRRGLSSLTKRRGGGPSSAYRIQDAQDIFYKEAEIPSSSTQSGNGKGRESVDGLPKIPACNLSCVLCNRMELGRRAGSKKDPPTSRQERIRRSPIPVNHDSQKPSHLHISVVVVSEIALHHQDSGGAVLSPSGGAFLLNLKWAHQTH